MAGFAESIRNIWNVQELRERILYTLGLLIVYRLGTYVTLPGVNASALAQINQQQGGGGLFGFLDMFVGGPSSRRAFLPSASCLTLRPPSSFS